MAYTKTEWKDQNVENPRTYLVRDNGDSTVTLMDAFGTVTELGTPVNAENMNKIENGIANNDAAITQEIADRKKADTQLQTSINGKQATITGGASTITSANLTSSRALVSNGSGKVAVANVTSTELGYLDGVTSAVQTQINNRLTQSQVDSRITSIMNNKLQVVSSLPSSPNADTFYFIPEK